MYYCIKKWVSVAYSQIFSSKYSFSSDFLAWLWKEDENKKQMLTQKIWLSSKYLFYFHPGYSVAAQANRSMKKNTCLKKFGLKKNIWRLDLLKSAPHNLHSSNSTDSSFHGSSDTGTDEVITGYQPTVSR